MDKSIGEQQKLVKRFLLGLELSNLFHFKLFWGRKKARARRMGAAQGERLFAEAALAGTVNIFLPFSKVTGASRSRAKKKQEGETHPLWPESPVVKRGKRNCSSSPPFLFMLGFPFSS